jgi:hypothetical protein
LNPVGEQRSAYGAGRPHGEDGAELDRRQVQAARGVEDESRERYVETKVEVGPARSDRAQLAIQDHPGEPLLHLRPHLGLRYSGVSLGKHLVVVHAKHEDRRDNEAQRVDEDRVRRRDCRDQTPATLGPATCATELVR